MSPSGRTWRWIASEVLYAVHEEQLAEHGGLSGLRDANALESAVTRPEQLAHYGTPDIAELAAAYGFGIAGNKLTNDKKNHNIPIFTKTKVIIIKNKNKIK